MAVQVRSPRGGWSRVSQPADYTGVVSRYAADIAQAKQSQEDNELRDMILQYNDGDLAYTSLKAELNSRLATATKGSSKEIEIRELLSELEKTENDKRIANKRAEMEAKFAEGGITAQEQLTIEEEVLKLMKSGTTEYQNQLATIAEGRDNAEVERKQEEVAELTAQLSQGGLTRQEEAQILEETLNLQTPGTLEYSKTLAALEESRALQAEEEADEKLANRRAQLIEAFKEDGITPTEALAIVEELRTLVAPGSEQERELIEEEASIREKIASEAEGRKGKVLTELSDAMAKTVKTEELTMEKLQEDFELGRIDAEEYLKGLVDAQGSIDDALQTFQGAGGEVGGEDLAQLDFNRDLFNDQFNAFNTGRLFAVQTKNGAFTLATLDDLVNDQNENFTVKEDVVDPSTGELKADQPVVKIRSGLSDGGITDFVLSENQTFFPVGQDETGTKTVDASREFAFIPKNADETFGFNVAAFEPTQKAKFIEQLRSDPGLRKAQAGAGAAFQKAAPGGVITPETGRITPEQEQSLVSKGFLSPVGSVPAAEQRRSARLPSILRGPVTRISKGIKEDVGRAKETFSRAAEQVKAAKPRSFGEALFPIKPAARVVKKQFELAKSSFKLPKFRFSFGPKKSTVDKVKTKATSLFGRAKSFISGLFGR